MEEKIKKIDINLLKDEEELKGEYARKRTKYIAEYKTYKSGYSTRGFFSHWVDGEYVKDPVQGDVQWNKYYPQGFNSWKIENQSTLTCYGEQRVINKINEIIELINKKHDRQKMGKSRV